MGFLIPNIDMAAHLGGLAAGFGIGYLAAGARRVTGLTETLWKAAAGFSIAITALAFMAMVLWMLRASGRS
jgi:hypothetical protein